MKYTKILMITILMLLTGVDYLYAGEKVDKSLNVHASGVVEISNVRGIVKIKGWKNNEVTVVGKLDDLATGLTFDTKDKVTRVKVDMPRKNINRGNGSNLIIRVPVGNRIDFEGVSSDLDIEDIKAGIDVATVSGDIVISGVRKILHAKTVSGDIKIKKSAGAARLATVSGDIRGDINCPEVAVSVVSGDVKLKLDEYKNFYGSVVSGDISVEGQQQDGGETELSSVNGDIDLVFTHKVNTRLMAKTGPGGDITNNLTNDEVTTAFPNTQKLSVTLGDGSGRVKLGTVNGDIKVSRKN